MSGIISVGYDKEFVNSMIAKGPLTEADFALLEAGDYTLGGTVTDFNEIVVRGVISSLDDNPVDANMVSSRVKELLIGAFQNITKNGPVVVG